MSLSPVFLVKIAKALMSLFLLVGKKRGEKKEVKKYF
jgi:hypothetical protein